MSEIDVDLLAEYLKTKIETGRYSIRRAAKEIGCSPATLSRLLEGSKSGYTPDTVNLVRAAAWLKCSLSDFQSINRPIDTSLEEVEVHLRALKGVSERTSEAMIAAVRALYDTNVGNSTDPAS